MLGGFAVEVKPISSIVKRFYRGSILRPRSLLFKAGIRPQTAMVPFRTTAVILLSPYLQIHSHHSFIPFIPSRTHVSIVSILLFIIILPPSLWHKQVATKLPKQREQTKLAYCLPSRVGSRQSQLPNSFQKSLHPTIASLIHLTI